MPPVLPPYPDVPLLGVTEPGRSRWRLRRPDLFAIPLLVAIVGLYVLDHLDRPGSVILVGPIYDQQVQLIFIGVLGASGGILLLSRTWRTVRTDRVWGIVVGTTVSLGVVAAWIFGGWLLMWGTAFSGVNSYYRLDVPGASKSYVVGVQTWHHSCPGLYEGNGWRFHRLVITMPCTEDFQVFPRGDFRVESDGRTASLVYPAGRDETGPVTVTIPMERKQ